MLVIVNFLKGLGRGVREKEYDREWIILKYSASK
jgi:hypothetical protein